ncbi:hypothetical protein CIPOMA221M_25000 [Citrobacter portucalensis]
MMPERFVRFRVMHHLLLTNEPAFIIIAVVHGDPVAFTEVADFRQPAAFVVLPLFRRFVVHRAVRQAVSIIVMPHRDEVFVLTAHHFPCQVIVILLRSPVKAGLLRQTVEKVIREAGVAAVLIRQLRHASGGVVCYLPRQAACGDTDRSAARIVLCFRAAAVRGNHCRQVSGVTVFIAGLAACRISLADKPAPGIVSAILAETVFLMNGRDLPETVIVIAGFIPGTVGEAQQLPVAAPCHLLFAAGGIFTGAGGFTVRVSIHIAGDAPLTGSQPRQAAILIVFLLLP